MIKFGIEQEIVFKNSKNRFLDFENTSYNDFQNIINQLPYYEEDSKIFECKSLEKEPKRWYVEGIEIFNSTNQPILTIPKAIEIRTTPNESIEMLVKEFSFSFNLLSKKAKEFDLIPVLTSSHPFKKEFNKKIKNHQRSKEELNIAKNSMLTFGMHLNISIDNLKQEEFMDVIQKLNYYLPFIIPFTFSSVFLNNQKFEGLSYRNYKRAKTRDLINIKKIKGKNIIEFRAFDSISNKNLQSSILYLIKDIILNKKLDKRLEKQDSVLIIKSSLYGFENIEIKEGILNIISTLQNFKTSNNSYLESLKKAVFLNTCSSKTIKERFDINQNIIESISNLYDFD